MTMTEHNLVRRLSGFDTDGKKIELNQTDLLDRSEPIVVLGDAGMGKTTLLEQIGARNDYKFVHARRLVRSQDPSKLLGGARTLVIDALDELTVQSEGDAVDAVLASLERAEMPNFILACRVADWRSATSIQAVVDTYGCEPLELFLEPISRDEACGLLSQDFGDIRAKKIIEHFVKNGLEELFGNPQTLKLIKAVSGEENLPTSRADLFELSVKRLWAEHSQKKLDSPLSKLSEKQALDAAGGAFSSLILAGKRALSRMPVLDIDEDDLPITDVNVFIPTEDLSAVLASRLLSSNVEGNPDRFSYTHRSVGEFLAARWLAQRADTDRKRRRLLKLFHGHDLVPASLRGVHAWLAQDARLATQIISADPMGVVEYGDTDELSEDQARALLKSLFELGKRDPRYYDFEKTQSLRGIAKPSLCSEIKDLIISRSTPFSLRSMLLHSVSGSPVAAMLTETLEEIVLDPEITYHERRVAGSALVNLPVADVQWDQIFVKLHDLADENSLRLALVLLPETGFAGTTDNQIVKLISAFVGLSVCEYPRREKQRIGGVLWNLERELPDERIEPVLDILAEYLNALLDDNFERFEYSDVVDVVYVLTERLLVLRSVDPLRLWSWLSSFGDHRGYRNESQKAISDWLKINDEARRRIQRFVLLDQSGTESVWMRALYLRDAWNGLFPNEADIIKLLGILDPLAEASGDRWKDLVHLCPHNGEQGASVRKAAAPFATEKESQEFLDRLANPEVPDWQLKEDERNRLREKKKQETWTKHREQYFKHIDDLRAGKYGEVVGTAKAYLGLYSDIDKDVLAHQRIELWLGSELQEAAFQGFEAFLLDGNTPPTAREIAESYAENKRWNAAYIFVAAVAERIRNRKPLDDLSDDRLLATLLEIRFTQILNHASIENVTEKLEQAVRNRSGLWEEFWRLRIEPQLAAQSEHVDGLYELARTTHDHDMAVDLAMEWLDRFPKLNHRVEVELIDCLIAADAFEFLKEYVNDRRASGSTDAERYSDWDAVAFLVNFQNERHQLEVTRSKEPKFLWHLRSRLGRHHDEASPAKLSPAQLSWIIKNFRALWPSVPHPSGTTSGDTNPWDATEYLGALINRLGSQTSNEAIAELSALRNAPFDGYTNHLKRAFAEQAQKVVEENYTPPTISELESVLTDGSPNSMDQLQAVMLEELTVAQEKIRSHPVDWYQDFFVNGNPKNEEACRDTLLKILGEYPYGILCEPEGHLADDKRADIRCTIDKLMLPIEIKGQWHKDLWLAADTQLDRLYSNDWRAEHKGIYLVLWFGNKVPKNQRLKSPGEGRESPTTADELRQALIESSEAAKQRRIDVVVLDITRP